MVETTEMSCSLDSGLLKLCLVHLSIGCFLGGPAVGTSSEPQEWTPAVSPGSGLKITTNSALFYMIFGNNKEKTAWEGNFN